MTEDTDRINEARPRRFSRYPEYKDSGIAWLGEIPSHWNLKRLKNAVARLESGGTPESDNVTYWTDEEHGIPWVAISDMTRDFHLNVTAKRITEEGRMSKRLRILPAGTLLYSMYASLGRVALLETKAVINQAILGVLPRRSEALRGYLRWWFEFMQVHVQMLSSSNTQDNLSAERVRNMPVVLPIAIEEQRTIAAFLDREMAKIDRLVERKERLIELLQEKRTALITRAVTRGLDPNAPMKDSGVEWLGEIPAHWHIAPVYAHYEVALGKMLDAKGVTGKSSGKYLRNVDVQWDSVNVEDLPEMDFPPSVRNRYLLRPEDLLVCEGGEVGRTAIWGGELDECFYQKAIHRVRPWFDSEIPRFFYFLMYGLAKRGVFTAGGNPNTINHLTAVQLRHYRLPFPATGEQRAIAAFLDRETARIDALIAKVRQAMDHLKEFRTALISAAVTGKIDVREEAS